MTERKWLNRSMVGIGEAMVEFAPVGDNLYRRGFAGDTLNTCWYIAKIVRDHGRIGYLTRVGNDTFSSEFLEFLRDSGVTSDSIGRDPVRSIGLYVISLAGAERSFSYWRDSSAARRLADDADALLTAVTGAGLIHISGITLAIVGDRGRRNLLKALGAARSKGSVVSYDPNARPRLWRDRPEMRHALREALEVTDIALPSFDDEATLWGDVDPEETAKRISDAGVQEIAVKNGPAPVALFNEGTLVRVPAPKVSNLCDTTGAGDSFNAGYLAGRLVGMHPLAACKLGQGVAGEVICHFGALAPEPALQRFQRIIHAQTTKT
ncbi:sugar kinase [Bradyrhizobium sp. GCM10027634]|uniref:sugar kinase n=1 Tax=unclassified Bradyrhizobium TaxID=2631580 RepID=UPI00263B5C25|nr:sugar kinase [Bradyrhizobium sp. WYCCWR 12677]MDN5001219.1 sugar kinase [Bradyrhizobium sp. WYCCWR 12677]